ncbi:FxLYD domain-containing protein [Natronolimnohabitans sp. A-GB9]|uniref:FxLYD domain-containing protein n=1 Tax=Natronolimnohabitans sp. A-GB9 TaxID=3069757 RepID=UPI0027B31907|nr:FxLYD domain-containing protein [Natronolimnohabitans sp. A-GB9]MDQ2049173.1 FxLYD domain-containing protein [Natronolimnohabitans sp. A-GB9]
MYRRAFLAVAVLAPLAGCLEFLDDDGEEITEPGDVEVTWSDLVRENPGTEDERVVVWGVVRNVGDRTLSYLEIRATFFDDEGEELESVIENVDADLSTGDEWPFDVEYPRFGEDAAAVATYELEPATGV